MQVFIVCRYCNTVKGCDKDNGDIKTCLERGCETRIVYTCKQKSQELSYSSENKRMYSCALCQYKQDEATILFASDE